MLAIARFYQFTPLTDVEGIRRQLRIRGKDLNIKGSILLAEEGINGTIAGDMESMQGFRQCLTAIAPLQHLPWTIHDCEFTPFLRLKVLIKKEIISMNWPRFDNRASAENVPATQWNELINDPSVVLLDTRNDYEIRVGRFKGAIDPQIRHFRHFPTAVKPLLPGDKNRPVAMYCTGGIRCEKASAWLRQEGFKHVFQLQGGILTYLEQTQESDSTWQGECFVFDQRIAVKHGIRPGNFQLCYACRGPVSVDDTRSPHYEFGVSCPHCHHEHNESERRRFRERIHQIEIAKLRHTRHIGPNREIVNEESSCK